MENLTGKNFGRYQIIERLGEGGMATVYKAYDSMLEREVAIKIIRREAFPPEILQDVLKRFEREAKSLARLSHPNIAKVLDFGEHDGSPYLVLEYLAGGTLKQKINTSIPWQAAVRLILPIARGIEYAHQRGILHRDIKPANILMTEDSAPTLSDFGIAKIFGGENTNLTSSGMAIGTPEYMAPEQWTGDTNVQSDVYALGVVLFELITGRKPYVADTPGGILMKQITTPLPLPREFVPDLPEAVQTILLKALAKDTKDRYANMGELISALENLLALSVTRPVATKPVIPIQPETASPSALADEKELGVPEQMPTPASTSSRTKIFAGLGALIVVVIAGYFLVSKPFAISLIPTETEALLATQTKIPPLFSSPTATQFVSSATLAPSQESIQTPAPTKIKAQNLFITNLTTEVTKAADGWMVAYSYAKFYHYDLLSGSLAVLNEHQIINIDVYWPIIDGIIAYKQTRGSQYGDIFIYDLKANTQVNLTNSKDDYYDLTLSPDGSDLFFARRNDVSVRLKLIGTDGKNLRQLWSSGYVDIDCPSWSADSQQIAFKMDKDIWKIGRDGGEPSKLTKTGDVLSCGRFSPIKSNQIAVIAGQPEDIFLVNTMDLSRMQLTKGLIPIGAGHGDLAWSPDGKNIAIVVNNVLTIVDIFTGNFAQLTTPPMPNYRHWFHGDFENIFAWSPDSQSLVFVINDDIYTIAANGSNLTQIKTGITDLYFVGWFEP